MTITGTGFADLAHHNTSYDGLTHHWTTSTADYADQAGLENAIVMDSSGNLHIVHINGGNYEIRHSVYDGSSWLSNKIGDCEGTSCWDAHMVIDDNDELHVAYAAYSNAVIYRHYDGSTWTSSVVSTSAKFGPVGIAVDSNNLPHISYAASGQHCGGGLRLASFNGTSWGSQSIDYGSNKGCDSSIVIDDNDHVYIAYQDRDNSKLKFATNHSGSWNTYAPDAAVPVTSMYPGYFTSLAMDNQGQFHIAHFDSRNEDLRYSTGVPNGQWTTTIVDASGHTGRNPSIAIDAAGDPHIVYQTWSGFDLRYATLNPSSPNWQKSNIETTGDLGDSNSIFIDAQGTLHVAYSDETNDVLRYATKATGVIETNEITVHFDNLSSVTAEVVDDETIRLTTPGVANPGTITLSLTDKDGVDHALSATFEFIDQNDLDGDGVPNASDDCPNTAGTSTNDLNGCPDDDGDGYSNTTDAFPNDSSEWLDSDGDGVGDNADAFPNDASETLDSDGDGVGDNADAFPMNAFETLDSDGDGVGDNADAFPNDASETQDSDGDGVGDNADAFPMNAFETLDSDGDGVGDNADAFPNDASETQDSDGDGVGDNADAFPNSANETVDSDGDGVGDNQDECPNSEAGASVDNNGCQINTDSDGDGVVDRLDSCPEVNASALDTDNDGCLDDEDEDGVIDSEDACPSTASGENVSQTGCSDVQLGLLDNDGDGVLNAEDRCPETPATTSVDDTGCPLAEEQEDEVSTSLLSSFFSGESDPVTTTFGVGAIVLALFTLLQTNAVAAVLPDAFRWVQVLRKNSKLTKEELNELTYLQSIIQAYYGNPLELAEELEQLRGDLTARYTNNDIKKQTREKLFTLIDELLTSTPDQLHRIAHNDAYFGLAGTIDTKNRTRLLNEKLAVTNSGDASTSHHPRHAQATPTAEPTVIRQWTDENGYTWAEMSDGTNRWWNGTDWQKV